MMVEECSLGEECLTLEEECSPDEEGGGL